MASPDPLWPGLKGVTSFLPGPLDELLGDASPRDSRALHTVGRGLPPGGCSCLKEGVSLGSPCTPPHITQGAGRGLGRGRTLPFPAQSTSLIPGSTFLMNFGTQLF